MVKKLVLSHISQRYKDMTKLGETGAEKYSKTQLLQKIYENRSSIIE